MNRSDYQILKTGDTIYKITDIGIIPCIIIDIDKSSYYWKIYLKDDNKVEVSINGRNKTYYVTKEQAEEYLREVEANKIKKKKMFEYEQKLNEELHCNTFLIRY